MSQLDRTPDSETDAEVRRLLERAGPRPEVPAEDMERFKAAAREAWRALPRPTPEASGSRHLGLWAVAATLLLALSVAWLWKAQSRSGSLTAVANVDRLIGEVAVGSGGEPLALDSELGAGSWLETGDGPSRAAIRLAGGHSLRIDRATRLQLVSEHRIRLERGAVYLDSGLGGSGSVDVVTPFGVVSDVGTQFEVRSDGDAFRGRVRVREGAVSWVNDAKTWTAEAGEQLVLAHDGSIERSAIASSTGEWDWVQTVTPTFDLDGALLGDFLDWASREAGWRVEFADPELAQSAPAVVLSGSIERLTPREAVEVVIPASGLHWVESDGVLLLSEASQ